MRKILWLTLIMLFLCTPVLSACDNQNATNSPIDKNMSFNTLTVDGNSVNGEVANAITTFSFLEEIKVREGVEYTVSLDIYGKDVVPNHLNKWCGFPKAVRNTTAALVAVI